MADCNCFLSNGAHRTDCPQWMTVEERCRAAESEVARLREALAAAEEAHRHWRDCCEMKDHLGCASWKVRAEKRAEVAEARVREAEKQLRIADGISGRALKQLAAANALLAEWHSLDPDDEDPARSLYTRTAAHLSAQPAAPTDHDRAVLEACAAWPLKFVSRPDGSGVTQYGDVMSIARAELARREAKR